MPTSIENREFISAVTALRQGSVVDLFLAAGLDLTEDLKYFNWDGLDFRGANLAGCDFTGAKITNCQFRGSKIAGAIFDEEQLRLPALAEASDFPEYSLPTKNAEFYAKVFLRIKNTFAANNFLNKHGGMRIFISVEQINSYLASHRDLETAIQKMSLFTEYSIAPNEKTFSCLGHAAEYGGKDSMPDVAIQRIIEVSRHWQVRPPYDLFIRAIRIATSSEMVEAIVKEMRQSRYAVGIEVYAARLSFAKSYPSAMKIYRRMTNYRKIEPDERIFSILISKSPNFKKAVFHFNTISDIGERCSLASYNALLSKIEGPDKAKNLPNKEPLKKAAPFLAQMERLNIKHSAETYEQLLRLSPDFETVKNFILKAKKERIILNSAGLTWAALRVRYLTTASVLREIAVKVLYKKPLPRTFFETIYENLTPDKADAKELLAWAFSSRGRKDRPPDFAWNYAIEGYMKGDRLAQVLRIASAFPHLEKSQDVFEKYSDSSIRYMEDRYERGEEPHHAANALGMIYEVLGQHKLASQWFQRSIDTGENTLARKNNIEKRIAMICNA